MSQPPPSPPRVVRRGAIAVVRREARLLVIRRAEGITAAGAICFPGGGIESAETEQQALVRELREELAVEGTPVRRLWENVTSWGVHLAWWLTHVDHAAELKPNPLEVAEVGWYTIEELLEMEALLESNRQFLGSLRSGSIQL